MRNRKMKKFLYSAMVLTSVAGTAMTGIVTTVISNGQTVIAATKDAIPDSSTPRSIVIEKHAQTVGGQDDGKQKPGSTFANSPVLPNVYFRATFVTEDGKSDYTKYDLTDPTKDAGKYTKTSNVFYGVTGNDGKIALQLSQWLGGAKAADGYWEIEELGFWAGSGAAPTITAGKGDRTLLDNATNFNMSQTSGNTVINYEKSAPYFVVLPQTDRDSKDGFLYTVYTYPKNIPSTNTISKNVMGGDGYSPQVGETFWWSLNQNIPGDSEWTTTTANAGESVHYHEWASNGDGQKVDVTNGDYGLNSNKISTGQSSAIGGKNIGFGQFGWNDILPAGLSYDGTDGHGISVSIYDNAGKETPVALTSSDYTVAQNTVTPVNQNGLGQNAAIGDGTNATQLVINLTESGKAKLYAAIKAVPNAKTLNTHIWTKLTDSNADLGGVLANTFQPLITPPTTGTTPPTPPTPPTTPPETPNTPNTPDTPSTPHTPDVYFGRFNLLKNSTQDQATHLAGATFQAWSLPVWGFYTSGDASADVKAAVAEVNVALRKLQSASDSDAQGIYSSLTSDFKLLSENANQVFEKTVATGTNLTGADYTTTDHGVDTVHKAISFDAAYPTAAASLTTKPAGDQGNLVAATTADGKAINFHAIDKTTNENGTANWGALPVDITGGSLANNVYRYYALVETVAPSGYELVKTPTFVKVTYNTSVTDQQNGNTVYAATVSDAPNTNLPFTGGQGLLILILTATGLIAIGSAGMYYARKHKHDEGTEA
ncbi:hypothetical protein [Lacticaseibacillus brantae]|nr:hypothetical protein [Lacticaseibacillus brantae]